MLYYSDKKIDGIIVIEPTLHRDHRGSFYECWQDERYLDAGIKEKFIQDNRSFSKKNVLRGIHFQIKNPIGQLVWVTQGEIFYVAVDLRTNSKTFSHWRCFHLSESSLQQIYMPPGIAQGFYVLSEYAAVNYKCTAPYFPNDEGTLLWNSLDIPWPGNNPIMSDKDKQAFSLETLQTNNLLPVV